MNCQEVVESMHRYLDRDLSSDETALMYQHIAVCPTCAETFQLLKSLSKELEELPAVTPPVSLVDAIMPRLDVIDRERGGSSASPKEASSSPAEMMPEIRRPRREASWWSTVGGRTAIGAAAAAVILGIAIFSFEPKVISEAELPYEESANVAGQVGGAEDNLDINEPEAGMIMEDAPARGGINSGDATGSTDARTYAGSSELKQNEQPDSKSESNKDGQAPEPSDSPSRQAPSTEKSDTPSRPDTSKDNSTKPSVTDQKNPSGAQEAAPPAAAVPPLDNDTQPTTPGGGGEAASGLQERNSANTEFPENNESDDEREMGFMAVAPMMEWTSPDGRYRAQLDMNTLVVYNIPPNPSDPMEVIDSIPLRGSWVNGEWSADSQTFKYRVKVDDQTIESVYTVKKAPAVQESSEPGTSGSVEGETAPAEP